jgi:hypothetical protein
MEAVLDPSSTSADRSHREIIALNKGAYGINVEGVGFRRENFQPIESKRGCLSKSVLQPVPKHKRTTGCFRNQGHCNG